MDCRANLCKFLRSEEIDFDILLYRKKFIFHVFEHCFFSSAFFLLIISLFDSDHGSPNTEYRLRITDYPR